MDKDAPEANSVREAAKDLGAFRREQRERALAELIGEQEAAQESAGQDAPADDASTSAADTPVAQEQPHSERQQAFEAARQQYEAAALQMSQMLTAVATAEFPEVRSQADLAALAARDPARYARAVQLQQAIHSATEQAQQQQTHRQQEFARAFSEFATRQDELAQEAIPELKTPESRAKFQSSVREMMHDIGVSEDELKALSAGRLGLSIRDARAQQIIADACRYRLAQAKAKQVIAQPAPPVQRPGVRQPTAGRDLDQIDALSKRLDRTGNLRDAARLRAAERAARR